MPPAYYKYQDKDVINFYSKIIDAVPESEIVLYNFEKLSGYKFSIECVEELVEKFLPPWRVALYSLGFVFLAMHLLHGFMSAFQSVGANNKYTKALNGLAKVYAIGLPVGFIFIALYHHFTHIH